MTVTFSSVFAVIQLRSKIHGIFSNKHSGHIFEIKEAL